MRIRLKLDEKLNTMLIEATTGLLQKVWLALNKTKNHFSTHKTNNNNPKMNKKQKN